jgi:lysophospholipase L1-like esterase
MTEGRARIRRRIRLTLLSLPLYLLVGEIAARVWVSVKYTPDRIEQLTTHSPMRGRFASHPYLPYALNPKYPGHNALGFRGAAFEEKKAPGVRRIACVGASTTYGSLVDPGDSFPAELGKLFAPSPVPVEVVNAGVPGWTSIEMLINLELRVLPLDPDVVVILPGRNEIFPQAYNGFQLDYTHFRRPGFNFTVSNFVHKEIFKWSRLALLACTVRGDRFGWSELEEHPLYGGMVWENRPTVAEVARNMEEPERMIPFRRNLEGMIEVCRLRGILVLLCTMQVRPEKFALDEFEHDPNLNPLLATLVERDNDLEREIATRFDVPLVDTARLSEHAGLFIDDSHLTAEGHRQQARMIFDALAPLLEGR